ncbi:MAG TPA: ferritin-like domain-containing protein [Thermoanaerobaculia bacterium]
MRPKFARQLQSIVEPTVPRRGAAEALKARAKGVVAAVTGRAAPEALGGFALPAQPPPELSWQQYAVFLLYVAAEIEHALLVQYLFAAYTLDETVVPEEHRPIVRRWQEIILGIAKEEMGHFISVQNVLRLVAAPLNLEREDYPFDSEFYPFDFTLEKLTRGSLSKYIYVEMPADWTTPPAEEVKELAREANHGESPNRVGDLYAAMIALLSDTTRIPDDFFVADTTGMQASFAEWGRSYKSGARGNLLTRDHPRTPELIIEIVDSRESAVSLLQQIAEQGEGVGAVHLTGEALELSHFRRFLDIFNEWTAIGVDFDPSRNVATNPIVDADLPEAAEREGEAPDPCDPVTSTITDPQAFYWAHLQNLRYRMLLVDLGHAFHLDGALGSTTEVTARGEIITWTFTEMYNIRALAGILVRLPLERGGDASRRAAGPPFQMPYTLELPDREVDRWRWHRELLRTSIALIGTIEALEPPPEPRGLAYLKALRESDEQALQMVEKMIVAEQTKVNVQRAAAKGAV